MRSFRYFQGFLCLLCQLLLILEVKCGTKRQMFDCAAIHICNCGLWDEYLKCWKLSPPQVMEISQAVVTEFFPGENGLDEDMNFVKIKLCNKTITEKVFQAFLKLDKDLKSYVKEIHSDPFRTKEQWECHESRACAMPLMGKCVEFGDRCD